MPELGNLETTKFTFESTQTAAAYARRNFQNAANQVMDYSALGLLQPAHILGTAHEVNRTLQQNKEVAWDNVLVVQYLIRAAIPGAYQLHNSASLTI